MRSFHWIDFTVVCVYLLGMVAIGWWLSRKDDSTERFFVGNRRLPWWAVGVSIFATQLSAITYIAIPGRAYETDWSWLICNMGIPVIGVVVIIWFLPVFRRKNYTSIYQILEERFGPESRTYGALAFILMQVGRLAVVLYLPSLALAEVTGFSVYGMIAVMGLLVTIYTVLGGIEVVIWTDVVQAVVLVGGALLALVLISFNVEGGMSGIIAIGQEHSKFTMIHTDPSVSGDLIWILLIGAIFPTLVPYASDQTVVQRYFTMSTEKEARSSLLLGVMIAIPASLLFFFMGTALFAFYQTHPGLLREGLEFDRIFPYFIVQEMPRGVAGLLIAAIFAGSMSSLDSSLNSIATVCVTDFYKRFMKPNSDDQTCLRLAKWITVVTGLFATMIAMWVAHSLLNDPGSQGAWDLFIAIQGLLGGGVAGIFCVGIFTKRANQHGVFAGLVISTGVLAVVKFQFQWHTQTYACIGILTAFVVSYLFSFLTTPLNRFCKSTENRQ